MTARPATANDSTRRAGKQKANGTGSRLIDRGNATVGLHDPHCGGDVVFLKPAFQTAQVKRRLRADIGIHRR